MSKILESILSAILIDMIEAQNQANIYSAHIVENYVGLSSKEDLLQFFEIPIANIKSFDLDLKFGLEQTESLIGKGVSKKIATLIDSTVEKFILSSLSKYELQVEDSDDLKTLISLMWNGKSENLVKPPKFQNKEGLMDEIQELVNLLRESVSYAADSEPLLVDNKNGSGLKAIFSINDLNSFKGDILCSINIKAEMAGMKAGFADEISNDDEKTKNRKIFLVGS
ncbi:hypothetical protein ACRN9C_20030 [Shewanella frigidimarina]|uniref:hypothetical protein n=1 Tax=Shewanella frigidimarina TaxID=56812 RepID=UPI003D7AE550